MRMQQYIFTKQKEDDYWVQFQHFLEQNFLNKVYVLYLTYLYLNLAVTYYLEHNVYLCKDTWSSSYDDPLYSDFYSSLCEDFAKNSNNVYLSLFPAINL